MSSSGLVTYVIQSAAAFIGTTRVPSIDMPIFLAMCLYWKFCTLLELKPYQVTGLVTMVVLVSGLPGPMGQLKKVWRLSWACEAITEWAVMWQSHRSPLYIVQCCEGAGRLPQVSQPPKSSLHEGCRPLFLLLLLVV